MTSVLITELVISIGMLVFAQPLHDHLCEHGGRPDLVFVSRK